MTENYLKGGNVDFQKHSLTLIQQGMLKKKYPYTEKVVQ